MGETSAGTSEIFLGQFRFQMRFRFQFLLRYQQWGFRTEKGAVYHLRSTCFCTRLPTLSCLAMNIFRIGGDLAHVISFVCLLWRLYKYKSATGANRGQSIVGRPLTNRP